MIQRSLEEEALANLYRPRILYFALQRLRDRTAAEEVAQQTLVVLIEALRGDRVRDPSKIGSFIFGIATNLIRTRRRKEFRESQRSAEMDAEKIPWNQDPEAGLLLTEKRRQVREALTRLSEADRELLQRVVVAGNRMEDLAAELKIAPAALRKRKSRAVARLKEIFLRMSRQD